MDDEKKDHPEHPHGTPPGQTPEHDPPGHEGEPGVEPHGDDPVQDADETADAPDE